MSSSISKSGRFDSRNFDVIKDSMLQSDELPLSEVIDCDQWQEIFDAHEIDFGNDEDLCLHSRDSSVGTNLPNFFQRRDAKLQGCCWPSRESLGNA